jgi:hypothetical protein
MSVNTLSSKKYTASHFKKTRPAQYHLLNFLILIILYQIWQASKGRTEGRSFCWFSFISHQKRRGTKIIFFVPVAYSLFYGFTLPQNREKYES